MQQHQGCVYFGRGRTRHMHEQINTNWNWSDYLVLSLVRPRVCERDVSFSQPISRIVVGSVKFNVFFGRKSPIASLCISLHCITLHTVRMSVWYVAELTLEVANLLKTDWLYKWILSREKNWMWETRKRNFKKQITSKEKKAHTVHEISGRKLIFKIWTKKKEKNYNNRVQINVLRY